MERPNDDNSFASDIQIVINEETRENTSGLRSEAVSRELAAESLDDCIKVKSTKLEVPGAFTIFSPRSYDDIQSTSFNSFNKGVPLLLIGKSPLRIGSPITSQPKLSISNPKQPQSLFLQALAKLNNSSLNVVVLNQPHTALPSSKLNIQSSDQNKLPEPSPPSSLTSAPPSYSFVLRQSAARRPRLMGTFIPSPSFINHTPPPNYAAAFDIYVDNAIPPIPRNGNFGFSPMPIVCPACGYNGLSIINCKITVCTHFCAFILCLFLCWVCVPLPYVLKSCKNVYHYCRNCRNYLGMYCPTSIDAL